MKIDIFKVEEWFNKYEKLAKYDLADTCIDSMSVNDLLEITGENCDFFKKTELWRYSWLISFESGNIVAL